MEKEIKAKYPDSNIKLISGSNGIFDIKVNGRLIYSKHETPGRRFPDEGEITGLIAQNID